jgi:hypothetical protein
VVDLEGQQSQVPVQEWVLVVEPVRALDVKAQVGLEPDEQEQLQ